MIYKINSSNISMIDYDIDNLSLSVYFKDGSAYKYYPIHENMVIEFDQSASKGRWFNENIRKNKSLGFKKIN